MDSTIWYEDGGIAVRDHDGVLGLYVGGACQGRASFTEDGTIVPKSPVIQEMLKILTKTKPKTALVIGGGACILPTALQQLGAVVDVVEPNEVMFEVARKFFSFSNNGLCFNGTGTDFLNHEELNWKYDCVILDAFDGLKPVLDLYTEEYYQKIELLSPTCFLVNFITEDYRDLDKQYRILGKVFGKVKEVALQAKIPHQSLFLCGRDFVL